MKIPAHCPGTEITTTEGPGACGTCGRRFGAYELDHTVKGEWARDLPVHHSPEDAQLYSMGLARLVGSYDNWEDAERAGYVRPAQAPRGALQTAQPGDVAVIYSRGTLRRGVVTKVGRTNVTVEYTTHTAALESVGRGDRLVTITRKADKFENVAIERITQTAQAAAAQREEAAEPAPEPVPAELLAAARAAAVYLGNYWTGRAMGPTLDGLARGYDLTKATAAQLRAVVDLAGKQKADQIQLGLTAADRLDAQRAALPPIAYDADGLELVVGDQVVDYRGAPATIKTLAIHPATAGTVVADIAYDGGLSWKVTVDRLRLAGNREVVVIPCGARKLGHAAPAAELYTGSYHAAMRRAAAQLATADPSDAPGRTLILSALYGLLDIADPAPVEPYELRLGQPDSVTPETIARQARELGVAYSFDVVILAGKDYSALAETVWPHARRPLAGSAGMGDQLARLKTIATRSPLPEDDGLGGDLNDGRMIGGPVDADGYAADMCRSCAGSGCADCGGTGDRPPAAQRIEIPGARLGSAAMAASEFTWQAWCHSPACVWDGPEVRTPEKAIEIADEHARVKHDAALRPPNPARPTPEEAQAARDRLDDILSARQDSPEPEDFAAWADGQGPAVQLGETYIVDPLEGGKAAVVAALAALVRASSAHVILIDEMGTPSVPDWAALAPEVQPEIRRSGPHAFAVPRPAGKSRLVEVLQRLAEPDSAEPVPGDAEKLADLVAAADGDHRLLEVLWRKLKSQESPSYAYELWDRACSIARLRARASQPATATAAVHLPEENDAR